MKMLIQTRLKQGRAEMICWLEQDSRVKQGSRITIKGEEAVWQVIEQYPITRSQPQDINRNWRVGGL